MSKKDFLSGTQIPLMPKLTRTRVARIVTRLLTTTESVYSIARSYRVTPRWIRAIRQRLDSGAPLPGDVPLGRPPQPLDPVLVDLVVAAERKHHQHPRGLRAVLRRDYGEDVPHYRLWKILKGAGLVKDTPSKQKRRKWVRWERHHSNSLWQMDWTQLGLHDNLLLILDDASRLIVGWTRVKNATAEVTWTTFLAATERYGYPKQILTDNGTQFVKAGLERLGYLDRKLRELRRRKKIRIQHIRSRVKHPQTGGKIERVIGTVKSKFRARWPDGEIEFPGGLPEVIHWYNTDKPHLSLRFEEGETPVMAYWRKWHPKRRGRPSKKHLLEVS